MSTNRTNELGNAILKALDISPDVMRTGIETFFLE